MAYCIAAGFLHFWQQFFLSLHNPLLISVSKFKKVYRLSRYVSIGLLICITACYCNAQKSDSTTTEKSDSSSNSILDHRYVKELIKTITRKAPEGQERETVKSENAFLRYEGKIVRRIIVRQSGFERSIYDTTRTIKNTVTRIANSLHVNTRRSVIRNNLIFQENSPLNPYLLADNERYLRDLDFILDSKLKVIPIRGNPDSVDVEVITRDVFSLGARGRVSGVDKFSVGIYEGNLLGYGQRVQTAILVDRDRTPYFGKSFSYAKSSLGGSLINLTAGYTELNDARRAGEEYEYAYYLRLDRPLVSPYSRMAGGLEVSQNWAVNVYQGVDSLFRRYRYDVQDVWAGYNIGVGNRIENRVRHFVALRYNRQHFGRQPVQENYRLQRIYNNQQSLLAEATLYNQNFYKTNYIYGFGRTEDVPYGQTINVTTGITQELGLTRLYAGSSAMKRIVRPSGRFHDIEIGAGSFFNDDVAEDGVFYIKGDFYSKLYQKKKSFIRHQFSGGYARAFNNRVRPLLTLNSELIRFTADSLFGFHRIFLRNETTVFTNWQLVGFRFAPFVSLEGAILQQKIFQDINNEFFLGSSGGVRIRNENLIFGTIEFRAFYFPKTVPGVAPVSFRVATNLRIKYSGSFVRPPDFVRYN